MNNIYAILKNPGQLDRGFFVSFLGISDKGKFGNMKTAIGILIVAAAVITGFVIWIVKKIGGGGNLYNG